MPDSGTCVDARTPSGTLLDATLLRRWLDAATDGLLQSRSAIDLLNVYPVPDGDTGTNLHLTLASARAEVAALPRHGETVGQVARSAARGALRGARGNSGVILSQLMHGWADALAGARAAGAARVAEAFVRADEQAWVAVESPAEGTILSVSRAASRAAAAAAGDPGADLPAVVSAVAAAARTALHRTTGQLDVLARAGVVDAGAAGLVLVLEALRAVVTGSRPAPATWGRRPRCDPDRPPASGEGAFEVMYLLDAADEVVPALRAGLAAVGHSIAVVGGQGQWHVHAHTDRPDAVVAAGARVGRAHLATVSRIVPAAPTGPAPAGNEARDLLGVVAWVSGPGIARAFAQAGAATVCARPGHLVGADELLEAARATGRRSVVVLPNDPDVLVAAHAAASSAPQGLRLRVVPTHAEVQGLAALAVHDAGSTADADAAAMAAAARDTRYGSVRLVGGLEQAPAAGTAHRRHDDASAQTLGLVDGQVVAVGTGVQAVALEVLDRLLAPGGDLVTLVVGAGLVRDVADAVARAVRAQRPHLEVVVLDGGQPGSALLVGAE